MAPRIGFIGSELGVLTMLGYIVCRGSFQSLADARIKHTRWVLHSLATGSFAFVSELLSRLAV
jgi:hypothetical protein